jgi:hypothetical protein
LSVTPEQREFADIVRLARQAAVVWAVARCRGDEPAAREARALLTVCQARLRHLTGTGELSVARWRIGGDW